MRHLLILLAAMAIPAGAYPGMEAGKAGDFPAFGPLKALCAAAESEEVALPELRAAHVLPQWRLALSLHRRLAVKAGNLAVSPYSIHEALSLAAVGAKGETLRQLTAMLGGDATDDAWRRKGVVIKAGLECPKAWRKTTANLANALFLQSGKTIEPTYAAALAQRYGAEPHAVDYAKSAETARGIINGWVEQQTRGRIKDLIAPRLLSAATRLTLVNAVFLQGSWKKAFQEDLTAKRPFHLAGGATKQVDTMRALGGAHDLSYGKMDALELIALPTNDHLLEMVILLPKQGLALTALEAQLTPEAIDKALEAAEARKVNLWLPKFQVEASLSLKDQLAALGIDAAFDSKRADFSGIDRGEDRLFIGDVIHKAIVKVNEKGFEAAAASVAMMGLGSGKPKPTQPIEVAVDRPFLFAIIHTETRAPLFVGRVLDPG